MTEPGALRSAEEAARFIERIADPVTKSLVNLAFVHLVKKAHLSKSEQPASDVDLLFVVKALAELFSEREVIARTLEGERVGAWFDEGG
jgi:hypothetical protein